MSDAIFETLWLIALLTALTIPFFTAMAVQ